MINNEDEYRQMMAEVCKEWEKNHPNKYKTICNHYSSITPKIKKYCEMCGNSFITNQYQKKFCSKKCKKRSINARSNAKQKRFLPLLPDIFPDDVDVDFHHISSYLPFAVPLPKKLHRSKTGNLKQHMDNANGWVNFYYNIDVDKLLNRGDK